MDRHAEWEVVTKNKNNRIIMIRDLERSGRMSVTNDAEYVYACLTNGIVRWRVIYQGQNDGSEWWEIISTPGNEVGQWRIAFRPWHGEVWDRLTRVETE